MFSKENMRDWELIVNPKLELVSWIWGFMRILRDNRGYLGFDWEYSGFKPKLVLESNCINCKPRGHNRGGDSGQTDRSCFISVQEI